MGLRSFFALRFARSSENRQVSRLNRTLSNYFFSVLQQTIVDAMQLLCENGGSRYLPPIPASLLYTCRSSFTAMGGAREGIPAIVEKLEMPWDAEKG